MNNITIGASEIPCIMGCDTFKTVAELWEEKKTGNKENIDNIYVSRGIFFQPIIIQLARKEYGLNIIENDDTYICKHNESFSATPDGFVKYPEKEGVVEIKLTHHIEESKVEKYTYQIQWQMMCTGLNDGLLIMMDDIFDQLKFKYFERDENIINEMVRKANEFMESLKLDKNPYIVDTYENTADVNISESSVTNVDDIVKYCDMYMEAVENRKKFEKIEEESKAEIAKRISSDTKVGDYNIKIISKSSEGYLKVDNSFEPMLNKLQIPINKVKGYSSKYLTIKKS